MHKNLLHFDYLMLYNAYAKLYNVGIPRACKRAAGMN